MLEQTLGSLGSDKSLIRITGKVYDQEYSFLVDSGASHNFVNESFIIENNLET
jgi:hypothetical protein